MNAEQLTSGARTVEHLAQFLDELQHAALELKQHVAARTRGYFTPTEDEETRHLLVSYCHARAALLELVTSLRHDRGLADEDRPAAFLVAYAGAILLVHAARFLLETFGDSRVVRQKLNEPEPHFGIPPDTYDRVQRSLTSPLHAWHLYHAVQYFHAHEARLRELGSRKELSASLAVVDRLSHRLDVTVAQYARARLRARADQALVGVRRDLLKRALHGVVKAAGRISSHLSVRPGHRPSLPPEVRRQLADLVEPGDVFITRKEYALTNYFLPGYWPHAALYLGDARSLACRGLEDHENCRPRWARLLAGEREEPRRVLEALKDGVRIRSVESPLACDALVVLRPRLAADDVTAALARGLFHEGKPYDFDFDFTRSDRLVCTEVVYRSYEGIGGVCFELKRRAGRLTLAAEDLVQMALERVAFEPRAVFSPRHSPRLATGREADALLAAGRAGCPA